MGGSQFHRSRVGRSLFLREGNGGSQVPGNQNRGIQVPGIQVRVSRPPGSRPRVSQAIVLQITGRTGKGKGGGSWNQQRDLVGCTSEAPCPYDTGWRRDAHQTRHLQRGGAEDETAAPLQQRQRRPRTRARTREKGSRAGTFGKCGWNKKVNNDGATGGGAGTTSLPLPQPTRRNR